MEAFYIILGLVMFAGNIFCSVYAFGGAQNSPRWLLIIAGIFNMFMLLAIFGLTNGST